MKKIVITIWMFIQCSAFLACMAKYSDKQINTLPSFANGTYTSAYIVVNNWSSFEHEKLRFAGIGYVAPDTLYPIIVKEQERIVDDEAKGDIPVHIAKELQKYVQNVFVGPKSDVPQDADIILTYYDRWRKGFGWYLDQLYITIKDVKINRVVAHGYFQNDRVFNKSPNPKKEVIKVIRNMLGPPKNS